MANILIVDDNEAVRTSVRVFLSIYGHDIREAADGVEATEACDDCEPDLVITDIFMPRKEGIETILEIHDRHPRTRVIALSGGGMTMPEMKTVALDLARLIGVNNVMEKPIDPERLRALVELNLLAALTDEVAH
ncbi:MAG: response regulator [Alphaproteobacteria bacterium]|nr:response regulator [Alphaproteobacteria bacterium]